MRIVLVGGGSGGATAPVLATAEALVKLNKQIELFLIGTKFGVETKLLQLSPLPIQHLIVPAGKWRRYFSFWNLVDLFKIILGFFKSFLILKKLRPAAIFGAGSYVQVPVSWAAFLLKIPVVIHQPDRELLLSTRLVLPIAKAVTISFASGENKLPSFTGLFAKTAAKKTVLTGNPFRRELLQGKVLQARKIFNLNEDYPTLLVMGGSLGAEKINQTILRALPELSRYVQIIHLTGKKSSRTFHVRPDAHSNYHPFEFLGPELRHAYTVADLVICRAGMSTITELAVLGKAAILIPLPQSPQEDNVRLLSHLKCAIGVFEEFLNPGLLVKLVRKVLWSREIQEVLKRNISQIMPRDADLKIAKILLKIAKES